MLFKMADKISMSQRALLEVMSQRYLKSAIYPSQCNVEKTTEMDCILWPVPAFGWAPVINTKEMIQLNLHQWNSILMDPEIYYWMFHNLFLLLGDNKTVLQQASVFFYLKMISSPYCAVSEPNVYKHYKRLTRWNANRCYSLWITYLWDLSNSFSNSFIDFCSCEGFHEVIYQEEWSIKLCVENGGWHESLNLLHVSRCGMLHFVTSYMKHNKSLDESNVHEIQSSSWP